MQFPNPDFGDPDTKKKKKAYLWRLPQNKLERRYKFCLQSNTFEMQRTKVDEEGIRHILGDGL